MYFYTYRSIALSGSPASGKSSLAKGLSEKLGWPVRSAGGLWRIKYAQQYPQKEVPFDEYWGSTSLEENRSVNHHIKVILENSNAIGDLRYVSHINSSKCLKVFLEADIDTRAKRASKRGDYAGMRINEVKKKLQEREKAELKMGYDLLGVDYRNPKQYHVVLNSAKMDVGEEVEMISNILKEAR